MHPITNKLALRLQPPKLFLLEVRRNIGRLARLVFAHIKPFITRKHVLLAGGIAFTLLAVGYSTSFFLPRTIKYSYASNNCFTNPVLLPSVIPKAKNPTYSAAPVASFSIAGYPLYSHTTCVTPIQAPKEHVSEVIPFGTSLFKKDIKILVGGFPTLASVAVLEKPISTQGPLVLNLSDSDEIFQYRLLANDKSLNCQKQDSKVECDIAKLELVQSLNYDFKLERLFGNEPAGMVFERPVVTVDNIHITESSIPEGQTVHDVPSVFTLTLNRPAATMEGAQLYLINGDKREPVAATATLNENTVTVHLTQPLARSASFVFTIENLTAADGGFLQTPFALTFKTSGGPKVIGINIGSYKVSLTGGVVITFDSTFSKNQNLQDYIRLEVNGASVATGVTAYNNTLTIKPLSAMPRCTAISIKILDNLQNSSGITGGTAWQFNSRTICQSVFSIGTSVQGRTIYAYSFGSGPSTIVFVGTIQGNEKSAAYSLNSWIDYLEATNSIPANRTIVVIPIANPDGYALNRRTNANNVDLNRNFPVSNWKSGVTMPDQTYNPSGGGSAPLSEPETNALASYILAVGPRLVLSYHASAGVIIPNDAGDSTSLAHTYDQKSNLGFVSNSQGSDVFAYDTTGAFEDWLSESPGIPGILLELWAKSGNEFASHKAAMWAMAQLP